MDYYETSLRKVKNYETSLRKVKTKAAVHDDIDVLTVILNSHLLPPYRLYQAWDNEMCEQ